MFHWKRETHNQARNREISAKPSSHNQFEDVMNIENNLFLKEQVDEKSKAFNHAHDIFKSNENDIKVDRINSMNIAKKSKK